MYNGIKYSSKQHIIISKVYPMCEISFQIYNANAPHYFKVSSLI